MNIFDGLKLYAEQHKKEKTAEELEEERRRMVGINKHGVYINEFTHCDLNKRAAYLYEDAFEGDSEAEWNID